LTGPDRLFEARVRAVLEMEARQWDSVKMTVTEVLTAWLLTSHRDRAFAPLDLSFFDERTMQPAHRATIAPADHRRIGSPGVHPPAGAGRRTWPKRLILLCTDPQKYAGHASASV
jgi:hypothetical protein